MDSKLKKAERLERKQQKTDAGLISERYPEISTIVIFMNYYQKNNGPSIMQHTVNFFPGSAAYFHMECIRKDCVDGGFNLEPVISSMMRSRKESAKGELTCEGNDMASHHARIDYNIVIKYNNNSN